MAHRALEVRKNSDSGAASKSSQVLKLAVSYARVSTKAQTAEGRSGLERQEQALQSWLRSHPDYQLEDRLVDAGISGGGKNRTKGVLGWFIEQGRRGHWQPGTVLVIETFSRFSREPITDVMRTLLELWDLELAVAFCDWGGDVLTSLESGGGTAYRVIGAADQAHREWREKRNRALGAAEHKRRLIAQGQKPFRERPKDRLVAQYPFWLNFNEETQAFEKNSHAAWVKQVFLWAKDVGSTTIARRLEAQGVRCVTDPRKGIGPTYVVNLLKNPAVKGYRQHMRTGHVPVGAPVPGVFPPIVSEEEWQQARRAVERRSSRQAAVATPRLHNLFQGRIFCAECCSTAGVWIAHAKLAGGLTKEYPYLRCNQHVRVPSMCSAPRAAYDESRLLQRLQTFRWADYFNDARHDADVATARDRVLAAEEKVAEAQQTIQRLQQAEDDFIAQGRAWPVRLEAQRNEAERDLLTAEADANVARAGLDALKRRRTGKDAAAAIQARVAAFMASDRTDVETRQRFNQWLFNEGLVVVFDFQRNSFELGTGKVSPQGLLLELDQVLDDAAAFGMDVEQVRHSKAAREQSVEKRQDGGTTMALTPTSQPRPTSSRWPQPDKAWGHVDRETLREIAAQVASTS